MNILLESVYYLDLGLVERNQLLCFLMGSYFNEKEQKAGKQGWHGKEGLHA